MKRHLKLVVSNRTYKRSDRVINVGRAAKDNKQRLKANHSGGFYSEPISPDAA